MEDSSSSFTNLLNSSTSSDPNDPNIQHPHPYTFRPHHYPMNYAPPGVSQNFPSHYPPHFNPFGGPASYQHFSSAPASYHGGPSIEHYQHGVFGGFAGSNPSSPPMTFLAGSGGNNSRADESSPVASASPMSAAEPLHQDAVIQIHEESESSSDENANKGRHHWSKDMNIRLVSAWLKNSKDSEKGNSKKKDSYWKDVAAQYNKHSPMEEKRTAVQLKNHWTKTMPVINKFNGVYHEMKSIYASGQSEDQLMDKVRERYKELAKAKRPFAFEYWWKQVKDEAKWSRAYPLEVMHKRARLNESGEYSSSTQDTSEPPRPQGQKAAIAERKGKGKVSSQNSGGNYFTDESMQLFNELQLRKSITAEKMADATLVEAEAKKAQAEARRLHVEAEKEKAKNAKVAAYLELLNKDTSHMDAADLKRHEQLRDYLASQIFS